MKPLDSCLERVRIQYVVAMTRCCDDNDGDEEFLFSPLPQSARKTPHFCLDGIQPGLLSFS